MACKCSTRSLSASQPSGTNLPHCATQDDPIAKYDKLCEMVNVYKMKNSGREPTFWLDKVCIDQANISDGLKVLPINVMACKQVHTSNIVSPKESPIHRV